MDHFSTPHPILITRKKKRKECWFCRYCNGEMKFTGEGFMSLPEKWIHVCDSCGYTASANEKYPIDK